jgi:hypothetical protein
VYPPDQLGGRSEGNDVGDEHRQCRQPAVEAVGHGQDGHANDRREQPEIGQRPSVDDELLEPEGAARSAQMAVEEVPGLDVEQVGHGPGRQEIRAAQGEEPCEHRGGHRGDDDRHPVERP